MRARSHLIGHTSHVKFFDELAARGQCPAAMLLVGPPMIGKTTLLEHLARQLLCRTGTACGDCESCRVAFGVHPDVLQLSPAVESATKDVVTTLLRRGHQRPTLGSRLIVILESVDRYSGPAVSLLLKAIEDAADFAHFFLTSESLDRVPETIRSRVLVRVMTTVPPAELQGALTERGVRERDARAVTELSSGRPGLALRLLADQGLRAQYARWHDTLARLGSLSLAERSAFAATLEGAETAEEVLHLLQGMLRDRLRVLRERRALPTPALTPLLRRSREAVAMVRANVPARAALEYVFFLPTAL